MKKKMIAAASLLLVIIGAIWVSLRWVWLVPILQSPDETTHFDYVLSVHDERGPLRVADRLVAVVPRTDPVAPTAHPMLWYLSSRTLLPVIRFQSHMRVPEDYGTPAYLEHLQTSAKDYKAVAARNPFYIDKNPCGYYTLAGWWLRGVRKIDAGLVFIFYGARLFSVFLLAGGLVATYFALRAVPWPRARSVAFTAAIAFFPLTSFVSSYVQPDNFTLATVSLAMFAVLRLKKKDPRELEWGAWLFAGITLGCLFLSKYHFFASVAPPLLALLLAFQIGRPTTARRALEHAALLLGPIVLAILFQFLWVGLMTTQYHVEEAQRWKAANPDWPQSRLAQISLAIQNFYDGRIFETFWGWFGWVDTPINFGSAEANWLVRGALLVGTRTAMALAALAIARTAWRLVRVFTKRGWLCSLRFALGDPFLTSLAGFTVLMVILFITTPVAGEGQGRHWYALLPAIFWLGAGVAPRITKNRRWRAGLAWLVIGCLLAYDLVAGIYSLQSVSMRYYGIINARGADPAWFWSHFY